jgi:hypothetical protein
MVVPTSSEEWVTTIFTLTPGENPSTGFLKNLQEVSESVISEFVLSKCSENPYEIHPGWRRSGEKVHKTTKILIGTPFV